MLLLLYVRIIATIEWYSQPIYWNQISINRPIKSYNVLIDQKRKMENHEWTRNFNHNLEAIYMLHTHSHANMHLFDKICPLIFVLCFCTMKTKNWCKSLHIRLVRSTQTVKHRSWQVVVCSRSHTLIRFDRICTYLPTCHWWWWWWCVALFIVPLRIYSLLPIRIIWLATSFCVIEPDHDF